MDLHWTLLLLGRVLLGGGFLVSGLRNIAAIPMLTGFMQGRGVPQPRAAAIIGVVWEGLLGLLVLAGLFVMPSALGLALFTIIATLLFHNFWDMQGQERLLNQNGFISNVMLIGGLLVLAAVS